MKKIVLIAAIFSVMAFAACTSDQSKSEDSTVADSPARDSPVPDSTAQPDTAIKTNTGTDSTIHSGTNSKSGNGGAASGPGDGTTSNGEKKN